MNEREKKYTIVVHFKTQCVDFLSNKEGINCVDLLSYVFNKEPKNKSLMANVLHYIANAIDESVFEKEIGFGVEPVVPSKDVSTSDEEEDEDTEVQEEEDADEATVLRKLQEMKRGKGVNFVETVPPKEKSNVVRDETSSGKYPRNKKREGTYPNAEDNETKPNLTNILFLMSMRHLSRFLRDKHFSI